MPAHATHGTGLGFGFLKLGLGIAFALEHPVDLLLIDEIRDLTLKHDLVHTRVVEEHDAVAWLDLLAVRTDGDHVHDRCTQFVRRRVRQDQPVRRLLLERLDPAAHVVASRRVLLMNWLITNCDVHLVDDFRFAEVQLSLLVEDARPCRACVE